ncbi:hypothetical protein AB0J82_12110 [Asanoa sp. NPDC049518]|uniref:hypothetical protein n=1 Tax=unclassified Asanoa TaxID=2685164 RepID=UPI0034276B92
MADAGNYQGERLWNAAVAAFDGLDGFHVVEPRLDAWRGAGVTVTSETVSIIVEADWVECELAVWVQVAGAPPVPVEKLVPELRGLRRLPRGATRGVLRSRLEQIVRAVQERAPEVLDGGEPALARFRDGDSES